MQDNNEEYNWLWNEVQHGNDRGFYRLYQISYDKLFRFGLRLSHDREIVKEHINGIFIDLWIKREKLEDIRQIQHYIFISYKRRLIKAINKRTLETYDTLPVEPEVSSYEQLLIDREQDSERKQRIEAAINKLTARQKELIRLRFFEQLSYEEIAERTSISVRTIYNTIHAAINLMRQEVTLPIIICFILSDQKIF